MANSKQNFLGLVKFTGVSSEYENQKALGKLIFAQITSPDASAGKYIYANGIEYKVADSTALDNLMQRVSTLESSMSTLEAWKSVVDGSISILDASVENHEGRIDTLESTAEALDERIADVSQDVIDISTYVHGTVDTSITDISTRLSNVGITAADNKLTVNGKDVSLSGSDYVTVTAADNSVNVSLNAEKIQDGGSADGHEKLATKGYVDDQIAVLEQALVFIGDISTGNVTSELTDKEVKAGYTYVATDAGEYDSKKFEAGDLIIVKEDSPATSDAKIIVVERNLDGAVTAGAPLDSSKLVVGVGAQGVKTIDVTAEDLSTAIANANSAIQGVNAAADQNSYVTISVENSTDPSTVDVSAVLTVVDTSADLAAVDAIGKLVDAKAVKDFIDDIKIQATLNSSTTQYVEASAFVDETGRVISASVGVKTATLVDASNGSIGLAMAKDVYDELTAVEETMAAANTTMANTIGLNSDYSVTWSSASGISADTTIVAAIEKVKEVADEAKQAGVTEFGGKTGAISIDTTNATDGSIKFAMDNSTLTGTVNGWSDLVVKVDTNTNDIADVSTRLDGISTRVDASIDALQAKDVEIDASIDRLDASVLALESRTITGESDTLTNANDEYVNVSATTDDQGNVTIDSSVQLANPVEGETHADATGLATDGWVKDFLAWDVIGE